MPLARIITKSADDSLELSMQLRSRGFRVETVAPDYVPTGPADLEVCLEECAPEDVLAKAAVVKESEDLWIFVAPGALDERSRPMRVIPLAPQVVEFRIPEPVAAGVTEIKPKSKLEVSVVEVKIPAPAPEDDPLLCELELQAPTVVQSAPKAKQQIAEVPPIAMSAGVDAPVVIGQPTAAEMPVIAEPAEVKKVEVKAPTSPSLERIKYIPVTLRATEIPIAPARVEPKLYLYRPAPPKPRIRGPRKSYKVAFQSGPKLWRTASITLALLVLAGLIATVVVLRPPVATPVKPKAVINVNPPVLLPSAEAASMDSSTRGPAVASSPGGGNKTIAGKGSETASQHQSAAAPHRSPSDDGLIAEDTVIYYNRKPAHHEAKLPRPSGAKRYTD